MREKGRAPEERVLWHRCLTLFISMGVLEPINELWFDTFVHIAWRVENYRQQLAQVPPPANHIELAIDEKELTVMFHDDLEKFGFRSEESFRKALAAQVQ
jgi:hypothetical protein